MSAAGHIVPRDSDDFRAGVAYAAHLLRHAVGSAHGENSRETVSRIEPRFCCQRALLGMAEGMALGFDDYAGGRIDDEHDHRADGAS